MHQHEQTNALNEQRKQIARDIHDELGASLTHIVQLSGETRRSLAQPEKLEAQTNRIASIAEEAVDNIGEIVWANNPNYDTLEDLVSYLREYAASFFALSPVQVDFDFPETVPPITVTSLFRRHLLMLVKEALQNVMKHAAAKKVRVSVALHDSSLKLSILDDGRGLPSNSERLGDGLANMRHRVVELDGSIDITSRPGAGAEIRVTVPLTT